jgi:glutathione S-transferase
MRAMILYNGPTSPFGRMARVVTLELDLPVEEKVIDVYTADFLDAHNPLRQIPTLLLSNGRAIYDSRAICAYFDSISNKPSLFAHPQDWDLQTRFSLALGLMEAGLQRRMEIVRPEGEKSASTIAKLEVRIGRAIDRLERYASEIAGQTLKMDQIATAVALEYTDYRFNGGWRSRCAALGYWLAEFSQRPSMVATRPQERK